MRGDSIVTRMIIDIMPLLFSYLRFSDILEHSTILAAVVSEIIYAGLVGIFYRCYSSEDILLNQNQWKLFIIPYLGRASITLWAFWADDYKSDLRNWYRTNAQGCVTPQMCHSMCHSGQALSHSTPSSWPSRGAAVSQLTTTGGEGTCASLRAHANFTWMWVPVRVPLF